MIKTIVTAADDNYALGAATLISSIYFHTPSQVLQDLEIKFAYVESEISSGNLDSLESMCSEFGIKFQSHRFSPGTQTSRRHITSTTFAKFFFLSNLEEPFLWIDSDAIVLDSWHEILQKDELLSTEKPYLVVNRPNGSSEFFNAGVFGSLPNNPIRHWEDQVGKHEQSLEQHIFQKEMANKCASVDPSYNVVTIWGDVNPTPPRILHFAGPMKPWHLKRMASENCQRMKCSWAHWFSSSNKAETTSTDYRRLSDHQAKIPLRLSTRQSSLLRILNLKFLNMPHLQLNSIMAFLLRIYGFKGDTHPFHWKN